MGKAPRKQIQRDKKNFFNEKIRGIAQKVSFKYNNRSSITRKQ